MKNRLNNHELKREIGFFSATVLVIANMVGTGIFTTSGFIMEELGNPQTMLLCWFVGGIFALCGASVCFRVFLSQNPRFPFWVSIFLPYHQLPYWQRL
jgi:APA family basic amino acid/polyamine antiporter